jgi:hypothetical protein
MWSQVKNIVAPSSTKDLRAAHRPGGRLLSVNEKRIATGYGPVDGGDVFHSPQ